MRFWRGFPRFVLAVLGVVLVAGLAWVLGPGAAWILAHFDGVHGLAGKDLVAALDAIRGRALAIATGLIALVAVYYTARNADTARRTFKLSEQGHVTDRYTKAIEQLGSDKLDIRLGGIYALERIARDSARDHPTVMAWSSPGRAPGRCTSLSLMVTRTSGTTGGGSADTPCGWLWGASLAGTARPPRRKALFPGRRPGDGACSGRDHRLDGGRCRC